ncbi:hypothetical protein [Simkania sp.]|uniref:hypothetical protein n=1 Tax=Simkania sp. TaxID=34094 RepID=UPI003B51DC8E
MSLSIDPQRRVGTCHPICIDQLQQEEILSNIGPRIGNGYFGSVYQVKNTDGKRVYKIIALDNFKNGDEIRVAQIAAEIGVAPKFHRAFLWNAQKEKK